EDLPVEVAEVVAGGVFAMLGELDGEAFEGRAVFADAVAFDDGASEQAEGLAARDGVGVEERGAFGFGHRGRSGKTNEVRRRVRPGESRRRSARRCRRW